MSTQTSRKRCHLCQSDGDHFTSKCPKIVCANCNLTGHAKKDCPNLLQSRSLPEESEQPDSSIEVLPSPPPNPKINDLHQRVSNLVDNLSRLEKQRQVLFELSKDSKYEDKLQLIPKSLNELNYLQSQVDQFKQFSSDSALESNGVIETYNHKIALSENSICQLRNWIHFDTFQSGHFANLNLHLVEQDRYLGFSENVVIPIKVESNHDLKRVGMVSLDGLPKAITLTSDFCNLLPDNTTFINVTVRENRQCIKQSDAIQYLKAVIPIQNSVPSLMDMHWCNENPLSFESYQNHNSDLSTQQTKYSNQVGAKDGCPASNESHMVETFNNKTENMETKKEKFEKLSQDFHHLNAVRVHKLKTLETLKKVHLQMCSSAFLCQSINQCYKKLGKVNKFVNPLKSLLLKLFSDTNGFTDEPEVLKNLEEMFGAFKRYHHEFNKDYTTIRDTFRTYEQIECVGEDRCFPLPEEVISIPVHIAHKLHGVKKVGIITTKAFPEEIKLLRNHIYNLLPNNLVLLTFKVGMGGDKLLYSSAVKCVRAILPNSEELRTKNQHFISRIRLNE